MKGERLGLAVIGLVLAVIIVVAKQKLDRDAYKAKVRKAAEHAAQLVGIPALAEFAITQSSLESGLGNSQLAALYNNYFGIKEGVRATVPRDTVDLPTKEWDPGQGKYVTITARFARYKTVDDCFEDWARYIVRKYPAAVDAARKNDFPAFARALKAGGYATQVNYAELLEKQHIALWA